MTAATDLDLNLLVVLDALYAERSVTRAAKKLGLTQPALSNALARLRTKLGDPLFVRSGRGIEPTARAQHIAPQIREALEKIDASLQETAFDAATSHRVFRVMATDYIEAVLLPQLLARLARDAPFVDLLLRPPPLTTALPRDALERGDVDVVLGVPVDGGAGLSGANLFSDDFVGVVRRGHPLLASMKRAGVTTPRLEEWAALPHVLVAPRGGKGAVDHALAALGMQRRIHVVTPHFATAPQLVGAAGSDLVVTMMSRAARVFAGPFRLETFPPPLPLPSVTFAARWHEAQARDPGHRWFRRLVLDVARERANAAADPG